MSHQTQAFVVFSLITAFAFAAISLLLHPLWADINNFLSTTFPVMLSAALLGILCFGGLLFLIETKTFGMRWHYVLVSITDLIMLGLLAYLLYELGTERTVLARQFIRYLPHGIWFGMIVLYLWYVPRWVLLQTWTARLGLLLTLVISATLWLSLPLRFKMTSRPIVFLQNGGVSIAWGTNMTATGEIEYSLNENSPQLTTNQTHGLKQLGNQIVKVFIPLQENTATLDFTATSQGIKAVNPTSVSKLGTATSEPIIIQFPEYDTPITFVSFSDLHEQNVIYNQLSAHIPWNDIHLAVYNGDLLNSTADPEQVTRSILALPTGERDIPRIFVRGNHETRNQSARMLDDWLLADGGHWYQSLTVGDTFFIVLDCGEDKPDGDKEYGGLVDFATYQQEQANWLKSVLESPEYIESRYRIVLLHIPIFGDGKAPPEFEPVAALLRNNKDIDLMINGHTHVYGIFAPSETGLPYPVAFSGGPETDTAAAVLVQTGEEALHVQIIDINGTVVEHIP